MGWGVFPSPDVGGEGVCQTSSGHLLIGRGELRQQLLIGRPWVGRGLGWGKASSGHLLIGRGLAPAAVSDWLG